ncbi:MAG: SHOCT domain-containing protein [Candidatus Dormibacteria bacterium]
MMSWGEAQGPMWGVALAWVVMIIVVGLLIGGVYALARSSTRRSGLWPDPGLGARGAQFGIPVKEDPLVTLRERYARGEIEVAEFEQRVDGLLRTEPGHPDTQDTATDGPTNGPVTS